MDIAGGEAHKLQTLFGHTNSISAISFSPNGECLSTASLDRTAKLWDAQTGQFLLTLAGSRDWVMSVSFEPTTQDYFDWNDPNRCGRVLATANHDGTVRLWNIGANHEGSMFLGSQGPVEFTVFSPDGRFVSTGGDDGVARIWNVVTQQEVATLRGHSERINSVAYDGDGRLLATAGWDGAVRLWDVASLAQIRTFVEPNNQPIEDVSFSPDGNVVAMVSDSGSVSVWDVATSQLLNSWRVEEKAYGVTHSPDGKLLVVTGVGGRVRVYDSTVAS